MENSQQKDLAALLDNLTNLVNEWLLVVTNPLQQRTTPELESILSEVKSIKIPFSEPQPQPVVPDDSFENQLAALSSLALPPLDFNAADALKGLEDFSFDATSFQSKPTKQKSESSLNDDLSSLTLPKNFDEFYLPQPSHKSKGAAKRFSRVTTRKSKGISGFDKNFFASISSDSDHDSSPSRDSLGTSGDCFGLSSLEALSASLESYSPVVEKRIPPSKAISYDDFFAGLNKASSEPNSQDPEISPRGSKLLRAFATKEDMNKRGMQKVKKRSQVDAKGQGVYQMEDAHYSSYPFSGNHDLALFCVFDGHVDKNAANAATVLFPEELEKNLQSHPIGLDCSELLQNTFLSTDARMKQYDVEGTTATAVLIWRFEQRRFIQTANVGDSTAFLCRNGQSITLSKDHKVNEESERERLINCGLDLNKGQNRINGLAVSRALGDHFIKENFAGVTAEPYLSQIYELEDERDTMVIVASDGLWDTMSGQEAFDAVQKMKDPQKIANNLVNLAISSGLCNDNITVTAILL